MSSELSCSWCGQGFMRPSQHGPQPLYCSAAHRQRAYEARRESRAITDALAGLDPTDALSEQISAMTAGYQIPDALSEQISAMTAGYQIPDALSEQIKAFALLTRFDVEVESVQGTLSEWLDATAGEGTVNVASEPAHVLKPIAAVLLLLALGDPRVRTGLAALGGDAIETVGFILALVGAAQEASAQFRGGVILMTIALGLAALKSGGSGEDEGEGETD